MPKLILMRHGESEWNRLNLFTGWVDIPLSEKGIAQAITGGKLISNLPIDLIFTSTLIRAIMTAMLAMNEHASKKVPVILHPHEGRMENWGQIYSEEARHHIVPVYRSWHLNERMYGELQGLNKAETIEKFGKEQVQIWRRSYDTAPPGGESLKNTAERTIPYFKEKIIPELENGKNILISAHGNSLRSIIMELDNLSKEKVVSLEIELGAPIIYEYDKQTFIKL